MPQDLLEKLGIKFLIKFSVVPNFPSDDVKFKFKDKIMNNEVNVRALPEVVLFLALPDSYPSS
jgi:hypothetical protein